MPSLAAEVMSAGAALDMAGTGRSAHAGWQGCCGEVAPTLAVHVRRARTQAQCRANDTRPNECSCDFLEREIAGRKFPLLNSLIGTAELARPMTAMQFGACSHRPQFHFCPPIAAAMQSQPLSQRVLMTAARLWLRYVILLERRPMLVKACTSASMLGLEEAVVQLLLAQAKPARALRMVGGCAILFASVARSPVR